MSLILEALKKSEAERRLGRAPDLLGPAPMVPPPPRRPWLLPTILGFGLALAGIGWWLWPGAGTTPAPGPEPVAESTAVAPATSALPEAMPAPVAAPRKTETRQTPPEIIANVPLPRDPEFSGTERESMPVPAGSIPLASRAPAPAAREAVRSESPPVRQATPMPPAPAPASPEPLEPLPRLAHLLPSEREGLPPLRLSMHVYDPLPEARFVLIDGKRYRQGETIAAGLVVEAIRSDGAVLDFHGRRFLLGRP